MGAGARRLSRRQTIALIGLAREAFAQEFPPSGETFDEWRHRQCVLAVERPGLSHCHNEDFLPLKEWFLRLAGRQAEAEAAGARAEIEPRTWALHKLHEACSDIAEVMPHAWAYAMGMLRKQGMAEDNADPKAVWRALYTVRRRAAQLRRKIA